MLQTLGAEGAYESLEVDEAGSGNQNEFPLMVSEHDFETGELRNEKRGIHIRIRKPEYSSQCRVESLPE